MMASEKRLKKLAKLENAVKIKKDNFVIFKVIEVNGEVFDITKVNSICIENINKFLADNSEISKKHKKRIEEEIGDLCRQSPHTITGRGGIIYGRENILKILGEEVIVPFFNDFVDKFGEHFQILIKCSREYRCSFK